LAHGALAKRSEFLFGIVDQQLRKEGVAEVLQELVEQLLVQNLKERFAFVVIHLE
jgi:hypothetical protein